MSKRLLDEALKHHEYNFWIGNKIYLQYLDEGWNSREANETANQMHRIIEKPILARASVVAEKYAYAVLEELKTELREYRDKYPDADFNDIMGYIAGYQGGLNGDEEKKFRAYEAVRLSGETNMNDTLRVRELIWDIATIHTTRDDILYMIENYDSLKEKYL